MGWRTLFVTQHAKISTLSRQLVIQTNRETYQIPVEDIQVLICGTPQIMITGSAIAILADSGAKVIFTGNTGQIVAETMNVNSAGRTQSTIVQQVTWPIDRVETLWTHIVERKIINQAAVLSHQNLDAESILTQLDTLELNDQTNREAVVARRYFPLLFGEGFSRETLDGTNAALNYGYAILLSSVNREITAAGFLTEIGIHHHNDENRFNLGCDLMEPFRPVIDQWVGAQAIEELTPDIKIGLVELLDVELMYNGKHTILRNAVSDYVRGCLRYLNEVVDTIQIEVVIPDEVSCDALNDHV